MEKIKVEGKVAEWELLSKKLLEMTKVLNTPTPSFVPNQWARLLAYVLGQISQKVMDSAHKGRKSGKEEVTVKLDREQAWAMSLCKKQLFESEWSELWMQMDVQL